MKLDSEARAKLFWNLDLCSSASNKYWQFVILAHCLKREAGPKLIFLKQKFKKVEKRKRTVLYSEKICMF